MIDVASIKEPVFVESNWDAINRELISAYENATGVKISKGQLEAILLSIFAYRENLLRIIMQETAKQNLLAYAVGEKLEHLGALLGVYRLPASKATTTLRFTFVEPLPSELLIPAGTRVMSKDEKATFETIKDVNVASGTTYVDIEAQCSEAGSAGNGYLPGNINILIDPVAFVSSVENISISYGGSDIEDDEHLRQRIQLAPEAFSNAGSKGAYEFWAKTAHQDIVDVSVLSPEPGQVKVVVLMKGGNIPSQEILDLVIETLNDERIRPLTDYVIVSAPEEVSYSISAKLYIYRSASMMAQSIVEKARRVLESYADTIKSKLGQDIVPEQIIGLLQKISGVYRAVLATPSYAELSAEQFAVCENIDVSIAGVVDG